MFARAHVVALLAVLVVHLPFVIGVEVPGAHDGDHLPRRPVRVVRLADPMMMADRGALRNQLKVERARHNLTQEQLAARVGVTRKTINTIETGRFVPSTVLALKLAKVFGVPVEALFTLPEE